VYGRSAELLLDEGIIPPGWLDSKAAVDLGVSDLVREFVTRSQAKIKQRRKSTIYRIVIGASLVIILAVLITVSIVRARDQRQVSSARERQQMLELATAKAEAKAADLERDKATAEQRAYMTKKESDLAVEIRNGQIRAAEAKERALTEQLGAQAAKVAELTRELNGARTDAGNRIGELTREQTSAKTAAENRLRIANAQIAELTGKVTEKSNDVEQIKESLNARIRGLERQLPPAVPPLPPAGQSVRVGGSISLAKPNAKRGSICCMVKKDGQHYILTLASILNGNVGDLVTQPARSGGGTERIGILWKTGAAAALTLPYPGVSTDRTIPGKGKFFGTEDTPESQPNIEMFGGGSGLVKGRVVRYAGGRITTTIPATDADLGAPAFNRSLELIGIVSAIEEQRAVLLPIDPILEALGVKLDN
jgi:FAD/FMN-containing dehydrogenase